MSCCDKYSKIKRKAFLEGSLDILLKIKYEMEYHNSKYGFYPQMKYFTKCVIPSWEKSIKDEIEDQDESENLD